MLNDESHQRVDARFLQFIIQHAAFSISFIYGSSGA
jgi:hypothetical protein